MALSLHSIALILPVLQCTFGIFRQSDFTDAQFVGAQLTYTEFRYSDMSGANLTNALIYGGGDWLMVDLSYADLTNAMMYD